MSLQKSQWSPNKKIYFWIKVLSIIGIVLAIYLLVEQITHSPFRPCSINAWINCDAVISGPVVKTLGLPTPLYGLIGYIVIFFAAQTAKKKLLLGMTAFGLVFCLRIAFIELFQLHVVCPVCVTCQLIMLTVFCFALVLNKRSSNNPIQ